MSSYIYFEDDGIKYLESTKKEYVDLCLCFWACNKRALYYTLYT